MTYPIDLAADPSMQMLEIILDNMTSEDKALYLRDLDAVLAGEGHTDNPVYALLKRPRELHARPLSNVEQSVQCLRVELRVGCPSYGPRDFAHWEDWRSWQNDSARPISFIHDEIELTVGDDDSPRVLSIPPEVLGNIDSMNEAFDAWDWAERHWR